MKAKINTLARFLFMIGVIFTLAFPSQLSVHADTTLSIIPNTWNVIGLDSNNPTTGPYRFPIGAKICSSVDTTNVTVKFVWDDTTNASDIYLRSGTSDTVTINSISAGAANCKDAFFEVEVNKDKTPTAPYDETRRYHITATDASGTVSTPQPRELYVEHLISQNRNSVTGVKLNGTSIPAGGTMTLMVGNTYTIELDGGTATQGYNQFEDFINFPNTIFQVRSVKTTYSADSKPLIVPPATDYPYLYADACGWDNVPGSPTYRSCIGGDYKAGGSNVVTTYTVKIISGGGTSQTLNTLLYDFSGSSYHYNSDFSTGSRIAVILGPSMVTINKSFSPKAIANVATDYSTMTITLANPTTETLTGVHFTDTFPNVGSGAPGSMTLYDGTSTNTCGGSLTDTSDGTLTAGDAGIKLTGASLSPNSSCALSVRVKVSANGDYDNKTGDLFINLGGTDTDTTNFGEDVLKAATSASCTPGQVLASWTVPSTAVNPPDTSGGHPTINNTSFTATASFVGNSSAIVHDTTPVDPVAGQDSWVWQTFGYKNTGATTSFVVDTRSYSGITMTIQAFDFANGPNSITISANGHAFPAHAIAPASLGAWNTIAEDTTGYTSTTGTTTFTITGTGAANDTSQGLDFDSITFTGCGTPPPAPLFSKAFKDSTTGATDVTSIKKGTSSRLTFVIDNTNASVPGSLALSNIAFTDTLPLGLDVGSVVSNTCGGTVTPTNNASPTRDTIVLSGGSLAQNSSCIIVVNVTGTTEGQYDNVSGFLSIGGTPTTRYAEDSLAVIAPPALTKSFSPTSIFTNAPDNTTSLTFTVTNPNSSSSLSGIGFTDVFPGTGSGATGNMTYSSTSSNTCGGSLTNNSNGALTAGDPGIKLSGVTLLANSSCSITVVATVTDASVSPSGYVNTTTNVTSTEGGNGNTASATLVVAVKTASIALTKQVATSASGPWTKFTGQTSGGSIYYRFIVYNSGDLPFTAISVSDPTLASTYGSPISCTWTLPLNPGDTDICAPATPITASTTPGSYPNTATVTGTYTSGTKTATSTATYATPGLTITKTVDQTYFKVAGDLLNYHYTVKNTGYVPLLGPVTVTDDKITTPNSVSCPDLFATFGSTYLEPGQSITCTATYTVQASDVSALSVTNQASAAAGGVTSNTDTKTVPLAPDLTIQKINSITGDTTAGTMALSSGTFVWTLTVNNSATAGPASFISSQTILQDDLPTSGITSYSVGSITSSGVTNPSNINCSITTNTLTCTATGNVTISTGGSFSVPVTVTPSMAGSLVNPRSGGACAVDPAPGVIVELDEANNNCATNTVTVVAPPVVTKSFSPTPIGVGGTSTMTITIQNPAANTVALSGVAFTDNLPTGMQVASTPNATITCAGTLTATAGAGSVSLSGGSVAVNTTCTIKVDVTATTAGDKTNTVTVTTTNGGNSNTASGKLSVVDATKTIVSTSESSSGFLSSYERVLVGEIVRYRLVTQLPQGTSTSFQFRDNIPTGLQYLNDNTTKVALVCNSGTACASSSTLSDPSFVVAGTSSTTPTYVLPGSAITFSSGNPTFSFGNLTNTDTVNPVYVVLEFNALVVNSLSNYAGAGTHNNNYTVWINNNSIVTSPDVGVRNAEPSITNLTKTVSPASGPYLPGDTLTYTLAYSNGSTGVTRATAFDVYTTDSLSSNLDLQSVNVTAPTGATVTDTSTTGIGGVVRVKVNQVAPAVDISSGPTGVTITVTVKIISTASAGQTISNSANLTYTSLPGGVTTGDSNGTCPNATGSCTPGTSGSGTGERNGADGLPAPGVLNDYAASASATDITVSRPDLRVTKDDGTPTYIPGNSLTYTVTVYNDGNITATGTVTDNFPAALTNISWTCSGSVLSATCGASGTTNISDSVSIPAGEHVTYTITTTVASTATGDLTNIASAALGGGYTDPTPSNNSATDTDTSAAAPGLTVAKSSTTASVTATGLVNYSYLVTNTGNVIVTGISVTDNNIDTGSMSCPSTSLAVGANMTCTASHTVTQAEINAGGNLTNTVTVTSTNASTVTDTLNIPISQSPTLTVKKSSTTSSVSATGAVNYSYLVTNTGNVTVTGINVTDNNIDTGSMSCPSTSLAVGANMTCTATHTVTQAEINAGGNLTNTVTVTSTNAPTVTDTLNIPIAQSPLLTVKKSSTTSSVSTTGVVSYSYLVTNTGNVTVTGIGVSDNNVDVSPALSCPATSLSVGANMTCTAQHTVTQAELDANGSPTAGSGNLTNTVTVTSTNASTVTDTLNIPITQSPALTVKKSSTTTTISATGVVSYSYLVTNTGNITVTGINVSDDNIDAGTMSCPAASLAVGASMTCTAQHTVTQAELDANGSPTSGSGKLTNTVTVTSTNASTVTDTLNIPFSQNPTLTVKKSSTTTSVNATGTVNYSYLVTNTGNVTVTGIGVADNNIDSGTMSCPATSLAVGANMTCTAQHTVTQLELNAGGNLTNTVTVTSTNASTVTDTLNIPISQSASLGLTKSANPAIFTASGQTITYTYTLTNNGNVSLTSPYAITDNKIASADISCASATSPLAPGASTTCTGIYSTTTGDVTAGSLANTASATAKFGSTTVTSANAQATINLAALSLTKSASPSTYNKVGDVINYTYVLKNTGNVTLSSPFTVTDDKATVACPSTPTSLALGDTITCTATYSIVQADLTNGSLTNHATAHALFGATTVDSNQDSVTVNAQLGSLNGTVFNDANANTTQDGGENGLSGVTIELQNGICTPSVNCPTILTASNGTYSFTGLSSGSYTVVEKDPSGYISSTPNTVSVTVPANGTAQANFGDYRLSSVSTNNISGTVFEDANANGTFDNGEQIIPNVTVTLYDQNNNMVGSPTVTAPNGTYSFTNLPAGVYTVVETNLGGYISTTLDHVGVTLNSGTNAVVNYGDQKSTATFIDPAVTKYGDPSNAQVGDLVTYTITVGNNGTGDAVDVVLTDTKPAFLDIISVNISPNKNFTVNISGNTFTINFGTVTPSDFYTVTVLTRVNSLGQAPGGSNNVSVATSSLNDPVFNDNAAANLVIAGSSSGNTGGESFTALPRTGFAPNIVTMLPPQPTDNAYAAQDGVWLEVPRLGVQMPIVGVPQSNGSWDITWLADQAGWLQGTAFPSWTGNSVLTGHVYLSDGQPGPFINLNKLQWGDQIIVHAFGERYTYEVRKNIQVLPDDVSVISHKTTPWVTLLTCKDFDAATNSYLHRVAVSAVLVDVKADSVQRGNTHR